MSKATKNSSKNPTKNTNKAKVKLDLNKHSLFVFTIIPTETNKHNPMSVFSYGFREKDAYARICRRYPHFNFIENFYAYEVRPEDLTEGVIGLFDNDHDFVFNDANLEAYLSNDSHYAELMGSEDAAEIAKQINTCLDAEAYRRRNWDEEDETEDDSNTTDATTGLPIARNFPIVCSTVEKSADKLIDIDEGGEVELPDMKNRSVVELKPGNVMVI